MADFLDFGFSLQTKADRQPIRGVSIGGADTAAAVVPTAKAVVVAKAGRTIPYGLT